MINSRSKGCKAERTLAKGLETWAGVPFSRTPSSGGLSWKTTNTKGDIVCTKEGHYFPFCIEVKFHKEIPLNPLIVGKHKNPPLVHEFWEQCTRDARLAGKVPLLFMRYNQMPKDSWIVVMPKSIYLVLELANTKINTFILEGSTDFTEPIVIASSELLFQKSYQAIRKFLKTNKSWLKNW